MLRRFYCQRWVLLSFFFIINSLPLSQAQEKLAQVNHESLYNEFSNYKAQQYQAFNHYQQQMQRDFDAYIQQGLAEFEREYAGVLDQQQPSTERIQQAGGDEDRALDELQNEQDAIKDYAQHDLLPNLIKEAEKKVKQQEHNKPTLQHWVNSWLDKQQAPRTLPPNRPIQSRPTPSAPVFTPPTMPHHAPQAPTPAKPNITGPLLVHLQAHRPKPLIYPFKRQYRISSYFGRRNLHYKGKKLSRHCGIDFAAAKGTGIVAMADGTVKYRGYSERGGNTLTIETTHRDRYNRPMYRYSLVHLDRYAKNTDEGQRVRKGQIVGYVGKTGLATGYHLHLTLKAYNPTTKKFERINPIKFTQGIPLPTDKHAERYQFYRCQDIS